MFVPPLQLHQTQGRHVLREGLQDSDHELEPVGTVLKRYKNSTFDGRGSATQGVAGNAAGRAAPAVDEGRDRKEAKAIFCAPGRKW